MNDCDMFKTHPGNLTILSQDGDTKVSTPRSLMPLNVPAHQFTPDDIFKKRIKKDNSLFSNFKDGKFWDNWRRSTTCTSNANDVTYVLYSCYSIASPEK